jgi:site-specific recombinase XerC
MEAARKSSRYGHRDATMILIGYRHGLRASELCDLQWSQVELATGRLHVRSFDVQRPDPPVSCLRRAGTCHDGMRMGVMAETMLGRLA